ncbi:Hsp20/alpha crystallin family protein [Nesterenkonia pannonica]|uniref:Hsp20/alpha crystallin family protein n=1 Tax=Nesterenkonia pannonica TaxID=1548602 RepID=UPI0021644C46|nr:Hsp20/alpha crystallin family protein [Nesterenkonia pannonica]
MPRVDIPEADILQILRGTLHTFSVRSEDGGAIVVEALLPHFGPKDITLTISTGHLLIQAERYEKADEQYAVRGSSGFSRSVALPPESRVERATAEFSDGHLSITVPWAGETECSALQEPARPLGSSFPPVQHRSPQTDSASATRGAESTLAHRRPARASGPQSSTRLVMQVLTDA